MDEQIRRFYAGESLSGERTQSILRLADDVAAKCRWRSLALAASFVALLLLGGMLVWPSASGDDLTTRVMREIAKNHAKNLQPEFVSADYQDLQARMSRLDFSIVPAGEFLQRDCRLFGGRYCSVQSELAAQLKLRDSATEEDCTLYVAPATPMLLKINADTRVIDGVRVQVWTEDGRLFGLARDAIMNRVEN